MSTYAQIAFKVAEGKGKKLYSVLEICVCKMDIYKNRYKIVIIYIRLKIGATNRYRIFHIFQNQLIMNVEETSCSKYLGDT